VVALAFQRTYNSNRAAISNITGSRWRTNLDRNITLTSQAIAVAAHRQDGKSFYFLLNNGLWTPDSDIPDKLVRLTDASGAPSGWKYTNSDDEVELYDASGKLLSITNRAGLTQTLSYDASGRLASVADPFGRALTFTYDASSRIATMTDPAGKLYNYAYDPNNNLTSVTYPDGKSRSYLYENTTFRNALTGITDENGVRFATYAYDTQGRAISSEHAGGVDKVSLVYNTDTSTTVTDSLGAVRTYRFQTILVTGSGLHNCRNVTGT
jgi:YD repeat-containing protein